MDEDTPRALLLKGTDPENDPLTYSILNPPTQGILTGAPPNVVYIPKHNYFGPDSFTFTVNDGVLNSLPGTGLYNGPGP
jgi:hypothetical protein